MSTPNSNYTQGSLLADLTIQELVNGREVGGIVPEGQADWVTTMLIEKTNAFYRDRGTGDKIIPNYEDRVAYLGDPTIKGQVASRSAVTGGIRINFSDTGYVGFRVNDDIDTRYALNQAKVVEAGAGYVVVAQRDGYTAPVVGDFPVASTVIARKRSIDLRGTSAPKSATQVPRFWKNHLSVMDDGGQESTFDMLNQSNMTNAKDYIRNATIHDAAQRFFRYKNATYWTSRNVNPESNGFQFSATSGVIEQIEQGGMFYPMTSLLTKSDFESRLRTWLLSNVGNPMSNKIVKTGAMGMALISSWYQDLVKYDVGIATSFTDGSVNGLNVTKVFIPGFEAVNIVVDHLQDMNLNGQLSSVSGFTNLPQTSGDFYFLDFTPVRMRENGQLAPALQTFYLREKYFYAFEQGLKPANMSAMDAVKSGAPLTMANLEMSSTTNDYNSFRMWCAGGINVMNRSAHALLQNRV